MSVLQFYWGLLKGSPNEAREAWETALSWIGVALSLLLLVNPELAKALRESWDGTSRWWAIVPVVAVAFFRVARNNHRTFEQLESKLHVYSPRLVPVKCRQETWQLIEHGAEAPHASCEGYVAIFENDPENPDANAHARDVVANISYFSGGKELFSLNGRWGQTEQPVDRVVTIPHRPTIDLETVNITIGQKRVLVLAIRMPGHPYMFAFNNDSYKHGFSNKMFLLEGSQITVTVRLRGIGVDGRYTFLLREADTDTPQLSLLESVPRPLP